MGHGILYPRIKCFVQVTSLIHKLWSFKVPLEFILSNPPSIPPLQGNDCLNCLGQMVVLCGTLSP